MVQSLSGHSSFGSGALLFLVRRIVIGPLDGGAPPRVRGLVPAGGAQIR
jgi:hypothetical protein